VPDFSKRIALATLLMCVTTAGLADELFRDPTRPYTARPTYASVPSQFKVNAIIVSDDRRLAIVNGRRVSVGDAVGGATVTAITKHELTLDVGGETRTLRLRRGGRGQ